MTTEPARPGPNHRPKRWVRTLGAGTITSIAWTLALSALLMLPFSPLFGTGEDYFYLGDVVNAVVYGALAWLLLRRHGGMVAWCAALVAVGCGMSAVATRYTQLTIDVPGRMVAEAIVGAGWVPGTYLLLAVVPWLVRQDRLPRHAQVAMTVGAALAVVTPALVLVDRLVFAVDPPPAWAVAELVYYLGLAVIIVLGLWAAADATLRWRRMSRIDRRGLGWLAVGTTVMAVPGVPMLLPLEGAGRLIEAGVVPLANLAAQAFFPAAILAVVLRQRLWGIELVVNRSLLWGLLTFAAIVTYVAVVQVVTWLVPSIPGLGSVFAAAVVAVAVMPVRAWLQRRVDHLIRGPSAQPGAAAAYVGDRLRRTTIDEPLTDVLSGLAEALRLDSAALNAAALNAAALNGPDGGPCLASIGTPGGPPLTVPLTYRGVAVADLVVTGPPGERLDARTQADLNVLSGVLATVTRLALTTADLAAAQARTQAVRTEERRLLRRELHDRLGPALAGVGVGLGAAGTQLAGADPPAGGVANLIARLREEVDRAAEDVRTLARTMLPPVLEQHGLGAAMHALADRFTTSQLRVYAEADPDLAVPADIAVMLYGILTEALTNVRRHAHASTCWLRLYADGGGIAVEVADDGHGIKPGSAAGVGLNSMRERADDLGGTVEFSRRTPTGTRLRVVVPASRAAPGLQCSSATSMASAWAVTAPSGAADARPPG
jgi:signal transduction histidine kinase